MAGLLQDLRYAARGMAQRPGFAIVAAATIAVGISATTVVFSLIVTLLLEPLPVPDPGRLVTIDETHKGSTERMLGLTVFSFSRYEAFRAATSAVFTDLAGHSPAQASLRIGEIAEVASTVTASANYFDVLGLPPAQGRFFAPDASRSPHLTAVISYETWVTRFGAAPAAIGRVVYVNSRPHEVIGVAPRGFSGTVVGLPVDIWIPAAAGDGSPGSGDRLTLFGRLRAGVPQAAAAAALEEVVRQVPLERAGTTVVGVAVEPMTSLPAAARGAVLGFMAMLLGTAGLVLLISSTNVTGMLLARASERRREIAIRTAIGASRSRIVRQLLVESVLLCLAGGATGVLLTLWLVSMISSFQPPTPMRIALAVGVDMRVLVFACVIALLTGILAGLAPALQTTRRSVVPGLREGTSGAGRSRSRLRGAFVVVQLAVSLLLLVMAGLFGRTLQKALAADLGFEPGGVVVAGVDPRTHGYEELRARALQGEILERVRAIPGVEDAGFAVAAPLSGYEHRERISRADAAATDESAQVSTIVATIGPGYLETLRIPLRAGRTFSTGDRVGAPRVAIVNQALARRLWPEVSPLGRGIRAGAHTFEVVGVTADSMQVNYTETPENLMFAALGQAPVGPATIHVRGRMDEGATLAAVRREIAALDPNIALDQAMPLSTLIMVTLLPQRIAAAMIGIFGAIGLLLAAIGLYGVLAFHVSARTREIGIRMSLGASQSGVIRLVMRYSLRLVLFGTAIGIVCALGLTHLLESLLYGISPTDTVTFAGAPLLLIIIASIATYIPARRATRVDPTIALRAE